MPIVFLVFFLPPVPDYARSALHPYPSHSSSSPVQSRFLLIFCPKSGPVLHGSLLPAECASLLDCKQGESLAAGSCFLSSFRTPVAVMYMRLKFCLPSCWHIELGVEVRPRVVWVSCTRLDLQYWAGVDSVCAACGVELRGTACGSVGVECGEDAFEAGLVRVGGWDVGFGRYWRVLEYLSPFLGRSDGGRCEVMEFRNNMRLSFRAGLTSFC